MSVVLVAGSAHLDLLARASRRDDVLDRIGDVSIEVGGTAANIAINMAHAGTKTRFLSAMNPSAYSKIIVEHLSSLGVEPHIAYFDNLPNGGFSAHINTKGELTSAISSMPVERVVFQPEHIAGAMDGCRAVMADCNLSPLAINRIVTMANDRKIPVYLSAVSDEKCLRIAAVTGRLAGIFLNRSEFTTLCKGAIGHTCHLPVAAELMNTTIFMTDGENGATIARPDGVTIDVPAPDLGDNGSRLGMGDAFAAGVVLLHEVHRINLREAAHKALKLVARVGANAHCQPGRPGTLEAVLDRFQHHAGHDAMTGCLNRLSTERTLTTIIDNRHSRQMPEVAVLMIDIDLFKSINDTYGHSAGDSVIVTVANAIKGALRDTDSIGRWGGEEFVVILPCTPRLAVGKVAERIRANVQSSIQTPRQVTVSIGCAVLEDGVRLTPKELVDLADAALYKAKHEGRNRVVDGTPAAFEIY